MPNVQQSGEPRLTHIAALKKWNHFTDSFIEAQTKPIETVMDNLVAAGATEEFLKTFWKEVKHLCWASTYGQSPWETAAYLGASLEARDLGMTYRRIGDQYVAPFRAAVEKRRLRDLEANGLKPFRVMLHEHHGDRFRMAFDCDATDCEHAADLAEEAFPGCEVISCTWFDYSQPVSDECPKYGKETDSKTACEAGLIDERHLNAGTIDEGGAPC